MKTKSNTNKNITTFDEHLDKMYGKIGTKKRTDFDIKAKAFAIGEIIKEERRLASMTQEQLAEKCGYSVEFVSLVERGVNAPSIDGVERLATALNTPIKEFFNFETNQHP